MLTVHLWRLRKGEKTLEKYHEFLRKAVLDETAFLRTSCWTVFSLWVALDGVLPVARAGNPRIRMRFNIPSSIDLHAIVYQEYAQRLELFNRKVTVVGDDAS